MSLRSPTTAELTDMILDHVEICVGLLNGWQDCMRLELDGMSVLTGGVMTFERIHLDMITSVYGQVTRAYSTHCT